MLGVEHDETITEGLQALDLFTDRIEASRRFCAYLNNDPSPSHVLVCHGDGGNGKSLLLAYLRTRLCRRVKPDNWTYLRGQGLCVSGEGADDEGDGLLGVLAMGTQASSDPPDAGPV